MELETKFLGTISVKYLQYWCEAKDFVHVRDEMIQNFVKTESFRLGKPSFNTMNFC